MMSLLKRNKIRVEMFAINILLTKLYCSFCEGNEIRLCRDFHIIPLMKKVSSHLQSSNNEDTGPPFLFSVSWEFCDI